MKTYRFVTTSYQDVVAESLQEAIETFEKMKDAGLLARVETVGRIEVRDEEGRYVRVDRPMRAQYPVGNEPADTRPSA